MYSIEFKMLLDKMFDLMVLIPAILIAFTFHEYAHGKVADILGDKTPRYEGRLTLNPVAHIDPMGFLMILLFGFGWAKPIRTNPSAYKNYYKDDLRVSAAGICANLLVVLVTSILFGIYARFAINVLPESYYSVIYLMINKIILINISVAVFNLLPIPGLDGFKILEDLMPKKFSIIGEKLYKYQMLILLGIIFFGGFIINIPVKFLYIKALNLAVIIMSLF